MFWMVFHLIKKAVIPAAGLGTRLLPVTKEMPKEMLPIFAKSRDGRMCLKPLLQAVFEQLYEVGVREFYFVVGRGKRAIEDHFTPDSGFLEALKEMRKSEAISNLQAFYEKVEDSTIVFVNQPKPAGFGDAVLKAKPLIKEAFLVFAGDTYIISPRNDYLSRLMAAYRDMKAQAAFVLKEVENARRFGVIEGRSLDGGVFEVRRAVEKPEKPPTNLAIMPVYVFDPAIFEALETIGPGKGGELQLTDGIQKLIEWGKRVVAIKLKPEDAWLDVGTSEAFWGALKLSYQQLQEET